MRAAVWACLSLVLVLVSGVEEVRAQHKPGSPGARDEQLRTAAAKLEGGEEASIRLALTTLTELGGEASARIVTARLQRGLPPQLIEAAIDTLVLLNRPTSGAALLELTQHRRSQIRSKAIAALGALKQQSAQAALLYALDDPSAEVRSAAVDALGNVGNARAVPALLAAADRGVPGAWQALGRVASPADVKLVLQRAPDGDVGPIRPALDVLVARADWSVASRARLLQQLAELGTPSVRSCLSDYRTSHSLGAPRLQQAIAEALTRLDRERPPEQAVAAAPRSGSSVDPKAPKGSAAPPSAAPAIEMPKARRSSAPTVPSVAKVEP